MTQPRVKTQAVPAASNALYDHDRAKVTERKKPAERQSQSPLELAGQAFEDFQNGPDIPRPNLAQSFIPVIGPAWEAVGDLQDGNYGAAAFNGGVAVMDALPVGVAVKGVRALTKGVGVMKKGSVTSGASIQAMRKTGFAKKGEEVHHTIPLNGVGRSVQDPRNHFALLKPLPKETHRRLHGSWKGKPRYDPIRRVWYGTTDWMKAVPIGVAGYSADGVENLSRQDRKPPTKR